MSANGENPRPGELINRPGWTGGRQTWSVLAVLALFVLCGVVHYWDADGDDLASSYVGCRLMATGNATHLYSYDPQDFASVGPDPAWQAAADWGGFDGYLHPYVQTPLWAFLLRPICGWKFAAFEHIFDVATMISFAACLLLVAQSWARGLWSFYAIGAATLCLWLSEPFRYAMMLMQTHILFLLLTLAALLLAERKRPLWAGLLLACAAAVKITPGVLVIYWILSRRWKAAASTVLWSGALALMALLVSRQQVALYLQDLHRISRVLLVAFNNQSLAAWWMGRYYPDEVRKFHMLPLPDAVRIGSMLLMLSLTLLGGWIDRGTDGDRKASPPLGAMIALIAGTVFAPIAWTHYSIVLIAPLMVLCEEARRARNWWIAGAVILIYSLNVRPFALNMDEDLPYRIFMLRSEFYSQMLCLAALIAVAWNRRSVARTVNAKAQIPVRDTEASATRGSERQG